MFRGLASPFWEWPDVDPDRTEELELALADNMCKKERDLLRAWAAADVAYQRILMEEDTDWLHELEQWRDEARRRADDIILGGA